MLGNSWFKKEKPFLGLTGLGGGVGSNLVGGGAGDPITATGGSTSTVGDKKVHKFIADGNFIITAGSSLSCEVFVVGGGGAGGGDSGGGGGAGAVVYGTSIPYGPGTYAVVVGDGGSGQPTYYTDPEANFRASAGGKNSTISHPSGSIIGGGGNAGGMTYPGSSNYAQSPASDGNTGSLGSNGGSDVGSPSSPLTVPNAALTTPYPTPGAGTYNVYRNQGGMINSTSPSIPNLWAGAGGGGAGGAGGPSSSSGAAGSGGAGYNASGNIPWIPSSEGVSGYFAGGGGAGAPDNGSGSGGSGGSGGGGDGSDSPSDPGSAGQPNSGSGGGGHDGFPSPGGGSGIVYVAYPV